MNIEGEHVRFIGGHQNRTPEHPVVVDEVTGCHLWLGPIDKEGYAKGRKVPGTSTLVHKRRYEEKYGRVPEGCVLDHVWKRGCRHRNCVNPDHLEPVSPAENVRRSKLVRMTPEILAMIRSKDRKMTLKKIAEELGFSYGYVKQIHAGKKWQDAA